MWAEYTFTMPVSGWKITVFEPSLEEYNELMDAYGKGAWARVFEIWPALIKSWDCTDREGKPLIVEADSVARLPVTTIRELAKQLNDAIKPSDDGSKNGSDLLPTSQRVVGATT